LLETGDISETITGMRHGVLTDVFRRHVPADSVEEQWELPALEKELASQLLLSVPAADWVRNEPTINDVDILRRIVDQADAAYQTKIKLVGAETFHAFERDVMLQSLDTHWREHLAALDQLRQGIHLRGYAQKNPKQEYKREAFELFQRLLDVVRDDVTRLLMTVQVRAEEVREAPAAAVQNVQYHHADYEEVLAAVAESLPPMPPLRAGQKIGRNDPCPCGSGKKYKQCHGKLV
jgi:preprotein translocase subunit SecA